jgi:hypothetical protein
MIKMTQPKWIVIAVCLCFGARTSFGQLKNADAYDQRIREENLAVAKIGKEIEQGRDGSAVGNNGDLTHGDAVVAQQQFLAASWNRQNQINQLLQKIEQTRNTTVQTAASHPGDKKAQANAQAALNNYNTLIKMGNTNGDRIYRATENLRGQDPGTTYKDPPNKIEPAKLVVQKDTGGNTSNPPKVPAAMPSDLELKGLKDGNKPPGPSDTGGDTPNPPKDDAQVPDENKLRADLQASQKTKDNIDKLITLAQGYKDANDQKATDNPDDSWSKGANAQNALDQLQAWRDRINNRITDDLNQLHPDNKKSADSPAPDSPDAGEVIHNLFGGPGLAPFEMGGVVMASDQGDASTQKFIDGITVNNGAGDTSNQSKNNVGDHSRDIARDANRDAIDGARDSARDAASSAVRDGVRSSRDNCPKGGGCH